MQCGEQFFHKNLQMRCRDSHPRTLARPCPNNALAERGPDCKENNWAVHRGLFTQLVYRDLQLQTSEKMQDSQISRSRLLQMSKETVAPAGEVSRLTDAEADVANGFAAEALF